MNDPKAPSDWFKVDEVDALVELALNLHWSGNHAADELWETPDSELSVSSPGILMHSCRSKRAKLFGNASDLHRCFRRVCDSTCQDLFRQIKARHTNPIVRHAVVNVETIWSAKIVAPVDARWENNIGNGPIALLGKQRRQHRLNRTITDQSRMLL